MCGVSVRRCAGLGSGAALLDHIVGGDQFDVVSMKCGRRFISVEPDADAVGVLTASDDRARLVGETHTSHRSECSHPNTIANGKVWLHGNTKASIDRRTIEC